MKRFVFWGAVLFFFNFFCVQKEKGLYNIETVICLVSFVFASTALFGYMVHPDEPLYLTFGNNNIAAEYIGFSLAFQLGMLVRKWKRNEDSIWLNLLVAISLTYIYFTSSRSIYLCVLFIGIAVVFYEKNVWKRLSKILVLTLLFICAVKLSMFLLITFAQKLGPIVGHHVLQKNVSVRSLLYLNTVNMISDNLLGVGVGQYEFASISYLGSLFPSFNEGEIFLSPHNEFFHLLVEDGVVLSLLFFLLCSTIIYYFWTNIKKGFFDYPELRYVSIVLFIQSLFQFPLINPVPYFMVAIMLGYFFSIINNKNDSYVLTLKLRSFLFFSNLIAFTVFITYFSFSYISLNHQSNETLNKLACSYGNRNWFACLNVASLKLKKGDYKSAEFYAARTLAWQPNNYQGMKTLGFAMLYQGKSNEACKLFEQYDSFFERKSTLHELIIKKCQDIIPK